MPEDFKYWNNKYQESNMGVFVESFFSEIPTISFLLKDLQFSLAPVLLLLEIGTRLEKTCTHTTLLCSLSSFTNGGVQALSNVEGEALNWLESGFPLFKD